MAAKKGKGGGKKPREGTEEYELGDDFLADLDSDQERDDDLDPETYEEDVLDGEEEDLHEIVSAETVEWSPEDHDEAAGDDDDEDDGDEEAEDEDEEEGDEEESPSEAEQTLVAQAEGGGGLAAVWTALGRPFRWLGRHSMPLWARFGLASFLIITSVAAATSISALVLLSDFAAALRHNNRLENLQNRLTEVEPGAAQTIMIIGSDLQPVGSSKKFQGLSDTTMLLRLDPDRNAIALFSLPRDLRVNLPDGGGVAKLNEAYTLGGPKETLKVVQNLTRTPGRPDGIEVNHLVNVDFTGFARAVNEINCVYIDVDRRYYHNNDTTSALGDYDEINIQPGYQALCGMNALDYVRYRHTDNDVVRAARQQDFLREARAKVPPIDLLTNRRNLIDIFTEHTTSDVRTPEALLALLKLFIAARDEPVKEVHFEGHLGPSYVTASHAEINKAVDQFLGIQDTPGAIGTTSKPDQPVAPEGKDTATPASKAKKKKNGIGNLSDASLTPTTYGKQLARGILRQRPKSPLPVFYPTILESGTEYAQKPRVYKINGTGDGSPPNGQRAAYKWVFYRPSLSDYYGFQATAWKDPPILSDPSEEKEIGGRNYQLFYDGDRLRIVAWQDDNGSYWVSNTLIQSLTDREMIEIARGMRELQK